MFEIFGKHGVILRDQVAILFKIPHLAVSDESVAVFLCCSKQLHRVSSVEEAVT